MKRIAVLALTALLASCASSPASRFYSLTAAAPAAAALPEAPGPAEPLRVAAVHIPLALDREEIVRLGPGNQLDIDDLNRWGAPLDEMVQRALTEDLRERLPAGQVVLPSSPAPAGTDRIVVDILQFQSDTAGTVVFDGSWSLLPPDKSAPSLIRDIHYSETASPGDYGDQAAAMSKMLGRLADDIVRSLPH
ncbi:MAG: PqiC family protein [Steroidobacteraceae bacterium]